MQSKLETLIEQAKIPGISIATASPGGKIATHTAGVINNNTPQQPVTETTIFEAASLSKPVFAYIVLKMAERGELDLDIPLYDQIGDFGPPEKKIRNHDNYKKLTAGMILSHQAGLPNEFERSKPETFDFVTEVGKQFNYSGEAYCFLQEVVEKIANSKSTGQLITLEDLA
ncbi:serine hydrolase domain-containing protein [Legionella fallonii]|uniref:Beta-lactamase-related domain-containing protein n=1 Tax=Legionella fallonii LLAP-10 TaxID=1212491 RepID=A0A098G7B6_9GAMM|nr:serine hydrolase domain-containing protein [Legionella fallonii]CEG57864.1 protein of unknown function [Legionella fallonii LLAP-10]